MKKTIALLLLILFITNYCFPQNKPLQSLETKPVVTTTVIVTNKVDSITAVTYKMLYDNQVKAGDDIRNTIFYALGGLASAMLLVVASNWVFNDKKVKDLIKEIDAKVNGVKKDALSELNGEINKRLSEKTTEITQAQIKLQEEATFAITAITAKFNEFTEKIRAEIKEDNKVLANNYQELIKSYSENLTLQIVTLKESYEEKIKLLTKQIEENERNNKEQLIKEIKKFKRDHLSHDADIYFLKGHYNNALKSYLDLSLIEFENGRNWIFKYGYKDIIKCLEKVTFVYSDELELLNRIVERSKDEFPEESEKIKMQYNDKLVKQLNASTLANIIPTNQNK